MIHILVKKSTHYYYLIQDGGKQKEVLQPNQQLQIAIHTRSKYTKTKNMQGIIFDATLFAFLQSLKHCCVCLVVGQEFSYIILTQFVWIKWEPVSIAHKTKQNHTHTHIGTQNAK